MKYAASNWTLVNRGGGGKMVRMGDGVENRHKRRAYERSSISHVNNIHLEYANTAYNTHYKHTFKALGTFKSRDKRATGHCEKPVSMHVRTASHRALIKSVFVLHLINSNL